jgi:hypothetical protein
VYVAGKDGNSAVLWKNGAMQRLSSGSHDAEARSVFVSGKDVYVAGWEDNGQLDNDEDILKAQMGIPTSGGGSTKRKSVATVWKNGTAARLTNGSCAAKAFSIHVLGNDVYVAGEVFDVNVASMFATLWENGVSTELASGGVLSTARSVFASRHGLYIAGEDSPASRYSIAMIATVWENGASQRLSSTGNYAMASANSIFVTANGDVLVAGSEGGGGKEDVAVVWRNGEARYLGVGKANSVFVK